MLSNFQVAAYPLLQSFLLGQEEFRQTLQDPSMEQLRQRVYRFLSSESAEWVWKPASMSSIVCMWWVGLRGGRVYRPCAWAVYRHTQGVPKSGSIFLRPFVCCMDFLKG